MSTDTTPMPEYIQQARALIAARLSRIYVDESERGRLTADLHALCAAMMHIQMLRESIAYAKSLAIAQRVVDSEIEMELQSAEEHLSTAAGNMDLDDTRSGRGDLAVIMANYIASQGLLHCQRAFALIGQYADVVADLDTSMKSDGNGTQKASDGKLGYYVILIYAAAVFIFILAISIYLVLSAL